MKIKERFKKDNLFFTSDTHFFHENIIKFCNRPFYDIFDMDQKLIDNWNSIVPEDGIVFHAGDFAMTGNIDLIKSIIERLNGKIYLTLGNHCYQNRFDREIVRKLFHSTDDMYMISVDDKDMPGEHVNFQITHYPLLYWYRGYYQLHGHVHSGPLSTANEKVPYHFMRYDIGVDNNEYCPISYHELKEYFLKTGKK